jgi:hypothetical protein
MRVNEVIDIALAAIDSGRVDVELLEPADISTEAVSALSQVVSELVENAAAFSGPDQRVRVNGLFEADGYLITISDDGVGISETMLEALNRILQRPAPSAGDDELTLGITMVARLASRHGIGVRLVPGVPGTTARVTVPSRLVSPGGSSSQRSGSQEGVTSPLDDVFAESPRETIDLSRYERPTQPGTQHVVSMTEQGKEEAEAFLESVFGPLRSRAGTGRDRPAPRRESPVAGETGDETRPRVEREPRAKTTTLRVRVPGETFAPEEDEPSVTSSEAAIDIRTALNRFDRGRRDATDSTEAS